MEALVPAFVAALLCQATDRSAWLSAILADRYRRPLLIALLAVLANALGNGVAAFAALWIAPALTPEARSLLLALALAMAGIDGIWPLRKLDRLDGWRLGPIFTPLAGLLMLVAGDRTQFFTLALAVRGASPWMAAIGAVAGACIVHGAAAFAGERNWRALPLAGLRIVSGGIALAAGVSLGLSALRLV
jgi:putative Ca2+/H+ antiporter (TMEM165/GDT1 family)